MSDIETAEGERNAASGDRSGVHRRAMLKSALAGTMLASTPTPGMRSLAAAVTPDELEQAFRVPPDESRPWIFYWWHNGATSREGITRDLAEIKRQGFAGVLVLSTGTGLMAAPPTPGAPPVPQGPEFMSDEWRSAFHFAEREAHRLGLQVIFNICDGWNAGGPWVTHEDACKDLVWRELSVDGGGRVDVDVAQPDFGEVRTFVEGMTMPRPRVDFYRDVAILACPETTGGQWDLAHAIDLADRFDGRRLRWQAPAGRWTILRFGYVLSGGKIHPRKEFRPDPLTGGWEIDPMSGEAMDRHFAQTVARIADEAGPMAGRTLIASHIDSWEIGDPSWTARLPEEFLRRRGYDMRPYLPALAGKTVGSTEITRRFAWDYRRTMADLVVENYYGRLARLSQERGLAMSAEAGGAGGMFNHTVDALECLGVCGLPMGEFWTKFPAAMDVAGDEMVAAPIFATGPGETWLEKNFGTVIQAAIAGRIYGRPINHVEAFTSFADDYTDYPYSMKAVADRAFCLGALRNTIHGFVSQPDPAARPGLRWEHVGTQVDCNVTWWDKGRAFFNYLARCQHLLKQGVYAADILYLAGETIPNYVVPDRKPIPGYNFDVVNADVLLRRVEAGDGAALLPGGLSYRFLVLPEGGTPQMSVAVLEKIRRLVEQGVTLVGPRPRHTPGLANHPAADRQLEQIADTLWGNAAQGVRQVGSGRVIWGRPLEQVLRDHNVPPALEVAGITDHADFDWIHRRLPEGDLYFLANLSDRELDLAPTFRVDGKTPELWNAVTGTVRELHQFSRRSGRTSVPLRFAPRQSHFVLFRKPAIRAAVRVPNFPALRSLQQLEGAWQVRFDPQWGGPAETRFDRLLDWTTHADDGIRHYSGTALYKKRFDCPAGANRIRYLDLGEVRNLAQVRLNGRDLGIVWTAPWRVDVAGLLRDRGNELEMEIVNLWPNRLIGDARLPYEQRRTRTNVRTYELRVPEGLPFTVCSTCVERARSGQPAALLPSGLLGPVTLLG